jgi:hypothetical protein
MVARGWSGQPGMGMQGKGRYNAVGPPASIAYEHHRVMAEEASAAPARASRGFCDGDGDEYGRDRRDEGRDTRRGFREDAREEAPRPRRSFREEGSGPGESPRRIGDEPRRDSPRRSFREEAADDGRGDAGRRDGGDAGEERGDAGGRKRRFVELVPDEAARPDAAAPDRDAAVAGGARGEVVSGWKADALSMWMRMLYMKQSRLVLSEGHFGPIVDLMRAMAVREWCTQG